MSAAELRDGGPWPGPRPYSETDRNRFFGREDERYDLLERLDAQRLVLLTAPTAVGKTSFLRASLVPELRRRRQAALERGQPSMANAVIVVRDWGIPDLYDPNSFFIRALKEGIDDLRREAESYPPDERAWMLHDHAVLSAAPESTRAYTYIEHLAGACGGLTLILDQFEEALQGSALHVGRISELTARLYKSEDAVTALLSFREEFLTRFNGIARIVGDLAPLTYYLRPIEGETLREALVSAARIGDVTLTEEALDELLRWMEEANDREGRSGARSRRAPGYVAPTGHSIDLLKLQALLLQLYQVAVQAGGGEEHAVIGMETLEHLKSEALNADDDDQGDEIVERALQRFIDSLVPLPAGVSDVSGFPADFVLSENQNHALRCRRAAARMGPSFSSGGFKLQQEQGDLLARSWREEWEVFGLDVDQVGEILEAEGRENDGKLVLHNPARFSGILDDSTVDEDAPEEISTLAGTARRQRWSVRAAASDLIDISLETLETLRLGNVLRRKLLQDGQVTYELVHDGFGDAFSDWSEEVRAQPLDALTATTAERGTSFRWKRLTGLVQDVSWRGCWIGPDVERDKTCRLQILEATFENCDLRGTVFDRCDFRGGGFKDCNLSDTVFWDCTFVGQPENPFLFVGISSSGLTFDDGSKLTNARFCGESRLHNMTWNRMSVEDVTLERCVVNRMMVGDVTIQGVLRFDYCWILLSDLLGLQVAQDVQDAALDINSCDLLYCRINDLSDQAIDVDGTNRLYPNPDIAGQEPPLRHQPTVDPWSQPA